jgi:hypothetical protein
MKINLSIIDSGCDVSVYLDGKRVPEPGEADDEAGVVWAIYRDVRGNMVPAVCAEDGAYVYLDSADVQVIKLKGRVEIRLPEGKVITEEDAEAFVPITICQVVNRETGETRLIQ